MLNERIKILRMARNLSQVELAKKLNISQPTVSEYITGKSMPALDTFANLCQLLDLDANDILCIR